MAFTLELGRAERDLGRHLERIGLALARGLGGSPSLLDPVEGPEVERAEPLPAVVALLVKVEALEIVAIIPLGGRGRDGVRVLSADPELIAQC